MTDPGIDFVDDDEAGGRDEDLPQHAPPAWRRRVERFLRGRYAIVAVVAVLVLAYLVVRAVASGRPTGTSPAAPSTPDASNGRAVADLPHRTGPDPTRCPGLQCYTASSVPAAVRAAVRAVFPGARFAAGETIRLVDRVDGNPLWYREVIARAGTATLTLRVQAHASGDTPDGGAKDDGARSVTFVDTALQQWFVRAHVSDRSGTDDVFDRLSRLVADRRLVAT